ncbi:hypothetical protein CLF_112240 [Clonorchis sinensis]|uniref:ATP-binding cassette transporter n=1 Tax=Clonorchis sinensis TaxID=79923 RepID=G7YW16_CLOSI|nr:hypothetical protein CLF_112240 [Clonorchis sinensis]
MLHSAELICIMLGGVCVPAMLTQANLRRKKAGTISTGQLGDHVHTNTIIVVNSMVGYQASFRFTPLATFLTLVGDQMPRFPPYCDIVFCMILTSIAEFRVCFTNLETGQNCRRLPDQDAYDRTIGQIMANTKRFQSICDLEPNNFIARSLKKSVQIRINGNLYGPCWWSRNAYSRDSRLNNRPPVLTKSFCVCKLVAKLGELINSHLIDNQKTGFSGPSYRIERFARPASHSAAASVRPSSVTILNTPKSVFKPRKPVYVATVIVRSLKQAGQQMALARTLDSLCIDICCLSETRTQDATTEKLVDPEDKRNYQNQLLECLPNGAVSDINGSWEKISKALLKAGTSVCGTTQPTQSKHWISDRTVSLLETQRQIPSGRHHNSTPRIIRRQLLRFLEDENDIICIFQIDKVFVMGHLNARVLETFQRSPHDFIDQKQGIQGIIKLAFSGVGAAESWRVSIHDKKTDQVPACETLSRLRQGRSPETPKLSYIASEGEAQNNVSLGEINQSQVSCIPTVVADPYTLKFTLAQSAAAPEYNFCSMAAHLLITKQNGTRGERKSLKDKVQPKPGNHIKSIHLVCQRGKKDVNLIERVQRAAMKMAAGFKAVDFGSRLAGSAAGERKERNPSGKLGRKPRSCVSTRLLEKRSQLFLKKLTTGDTEDELAFRKMRNRCKSEIRQWNIRKQATILQGLANRFFTVDPANTRRGHGERQLLNDKNKTDPGNLGKSLAPVYQSVNP